MCVHVGKTWKATNKNISYVGGFFVFTYFMCFLYLETTCESPGSGQHNIIKAMKWKPQNHVETQKQGNNQQQVLVSGSFSKLSAVSRSQLLLSLHNTTPVVL